MLSSTQKNSVTGSVYFSKEGVCWFQQVFRAARDPPHTPKSHLGQVDMRQHGAGCGLAAEDAGQVGLAVGHEQLHRILGLAAPVGPPQESWSSSK